MLNNGYFQKLRPDERSEQKKEGVTYSPLPYEQPSDADCGDGLQTVSSLADDPIPETVESELYIPGYLNTQLGKYMRVEFLIGNTLTDRTGRLVKVGASYILLETQSGDLVVCDLFSIKFITIVESPQLLI